MTYILINWSSSKRRVSSEKYYYKNTQMGRTVVKKIGRDRNWLLHIRKAQELLINVCKTSNLSLKHVKSLHSLLIKPWTRIKRVIGVITVERWNTNEQLHYSFLTASLQHHNYSFIVSRMNWRLGKDDKIYQKLGKRHTCQERQVGRPETNFLSRTLDLLDIRFLDLINKNKCQNPRVASSRQCDVKKGILKVSAELEVNFAVLSFPEQQQTARM